jgi:hypothetical protein
MAEDDKRLKIGFRGDLREGLSRIWSFQSASQAISVDRGRRSTVPPENLEISERMRLILPSQFSLMLILLTSLLAILTSLSFVRVLPCKGATCSTRARDSGVLTQTVTSAQKDVSPEAQK